MYSLRKKNGYCRYRNNLSLMKFQEHWIRQYILDFPWQLWQIMSLNLLVNLFFPISMKSLQGLTTDLKQVAPLQFLGAERVTLLFYLVLFHTACHVVGRENCSQSCDRILPRWSSLFALFARTLERQKNLRKSGPSLARLHFSTYAYSCNPILLECIFQPTACNPIWQLHGNFPCHVLTD